MTADVRTRRATLQDLDVLLEFEQGIVAAERPFDPTLKDGTIHYYDLRELIVANDAEVIVVETDEQVIGSGYARIMEAKPYLRHARYALIGFMYVVPAWRGRGVSRMVLDALQQWAAAKEVSEIRLEVYAQNQAAIRAYEKAGFVGNMLEMRRELPR